MMFTVYDSQTAKRIAHCFAQAPRRQQMCHEERHLRMRQLRVTQALMSGYVKIEVEPSSASAAQEDTSRKVKLQMPMIQESELRGLFPYAVLSDSSKAIVRSFMNSMLMSDSNVDPIELTEVLLEARMSPKLTEMLSTTLANCKTMVQKNEVATFGLVLEESIEALLPSVPMCDLQPNLVGAVCPECCESSIDVQ